MSVKVFYRYEFGDSFFYDKGKEYPSEDGMIVDDFGKLREVYENGDGWKFTRIERQTFERDGVTWFRHTPGDPMPCDGGAMVYTLLKGNALGAGGGKYAAIRASWSCKNHLNSEIIGWRYADEQKPVERHVVADKPATSFHEDDDGPDDEMQNADIAAMDWHAESEGERNYRLKREAKLNTERDKAAQKQSDEIRNSEEVGRAMGTVNKFMLGYRE